MINQKGQNGQTLIEVLVALGVAIIVITAITVAVTSALSNNQFIKNQNLATQYATQGLEYVRQIRGSNYSTLLTYRELSYCLDQNSNLTPMAGSCPQNVGIFRREIDLQHNSAYCSGGSRVTAIVSWSDNKCTNVNNLFCHEVRLVSCLSATSNTQLP